MSLTADGTAPPNGRALVEPPRYVASQTHKRRRGALSNPKKWYKWHPHPRLRPAAAIPQRASTTASRLSHRPEQWLRCAGDLRRGCGTKGGEQADQRATSRQ